MKGIFRSGWTELTALAALAAPVSAMGFGFDCSDFRTQRHVSIVTTYTPSSGGLNGSCGKSASQWDTCQLYFKKHMSGHAPAVMAAVPQKGESADLYGGIYFADFPRRNLKTREWVPSPRFAHVIVGDHFDAMYNNLNKIDIAIETDDKNDPDFQSINALTQFEEAREGDKLWFKPAHPMGPGLDLILCGSVPAFKNTFRKIKRDMEAIRKFDEAVKTKRGAIP